MHKHFNTSGLKIDDLLDLVGQIVVGPGRSNDRNDFLRKFELLFDGLVLEGGVFAVRGRVRRHADGRSLVRRFARQTLVDKVKQVKQRKTEFKGYFELGV